MGSCLPLELALSLSFLVKLLASELAILVDLGVVVEKEGIPCEEKRESTPLDPLDDPTNQYVVFLTHYNMLI